MFPSIKSDGRRFASPPQGPPGRVPLLQRYYQSVTTSCHPSRRASLPSLGDTSVGTRSFRSSADEHPPPRPGVGDPVAPAGNLPRRRQDLPSSWGTPIVRLHMFFDSGRTACTRPFRCSSVAPTMTKAKAPTIGLSKLNSMAFGLAVYASQCRLPEHHARLASSRWSDATGRASHPQGSNERFQSVSLHAHPPLPSFAWRNRIKRMSF